MYQIRLEEAIDKYHEYRGSLGYGTNTVANDKTALKRLLLETGNIPMRDFGPNQGARFQAALLSGKAPTRKPLLPDTVNSYMVVAKRFVAWAQIENILTPGVNPLALTRKLPVKKLPRKFIDREDFPRLLDCAETPQERIVVALGLYLFVRASEIVDLEVGRVHLSKGIIGVYQRKTGKWDDMPITKGLDRELRRWLEWYAADQAGVGRALQDDWPLVPPRVTPSFKNDTGFRGGYPEFPEFGVMNPYGRMTTPHERVKAVLTRFGWEFTGKDRIGNHTLRRSGARAYFYRMLELGEVRDGVLARVMSMLHHESVRTTEIYLELKEDIEKRNDAMIGEDMFGEDELTANVVPIRRASEEA